MRSINIINFAKVDKTLIHKKWIICHFFWNPLLSISGGYNLTLLIHSCLKWYTKSWNLLQHPLEISWEIYSPNLFQSELFGTALWQETKHQEDFTANYSLSEKFLTWTLMTSHKMPKNNSHTYFDDTNKPTFISQIYGQTHCSDNNWPL